MFVGLQVCEGWCGSGTAGESAGYWDDKEGHLCLCAHSKSQI